MKFQVIVVPQAQREIQQQFDYIKNRSTQGANSWANAFHASLGALETRPESFALSAESEDHSEDIRDLLFRTRRGGTYRALFVIRDKTVFVLHIRCPGQDAMLPGEVVLPE